jgi:hypothetical protein
MTKSCLFEVGIKLFGVYLIMFAISYGLPTVIGYFAYRETMVDASWMKVTFGSGIAQFYIPLFVGILFMVLGTRIGNVVIRNPSGEIVQGSEERQRPWELFDVLLKILVLYYLLSTGGALVATCYEIFAVSLGSEAWEQDQLNSDFIYNVVTLVIAIFLLRNSKWVYGLSRSQLPDSTPSA